MNTQKVREIQVLLSQKFRTRTQRFERFIPLLSFIAGFLWDSATLTRIDRLKDNLLLLAYWLGLSLTLVLSQLARAQALKHPKLIEYQRYYPWLMNFFQGGLFSAYVVYYFQSASLSKNFLFVVLLALLLVANEFLKTRLEALGLQLALYFLLTQSFAAFFFPIISRTISHPVFVVAGVFSFVALVVILAVLYRSQVITKDRDLLKLFGIGVCCFGVIETAYQSNLIPPVPLSLKNAGVYHTVNKQGARYQLGYEPAKWHQFWRTSDPIFHFQPGKDQVVGFFSIFAPPGIKMNIDELWMWKNPATQTWQQRDAHQFTIEGGREEGWRSYFIKKKMVEGQWRVRLQDKESRLLGVFEFEVEFVSTPVKPLEIVVR